ncbi:glycine cleavage system H protein 3, mitochondrial isoform X1 [Malania oleifera]|uniref:glycine cleavage system H protein 3, mitochondrial isoform X1 n=1 Tax=Malania oleifera TaxID=397392 RepID=UPI0025AE428D|nr:glycine cleavage system H protein 3, mitochondrial isoform X1 [Malania oleifera]
MALRMWASSTANTLGLSSASKLNFSPAFSLSRCFSTVLGGLKYATSHEWVKHEGPVATIGITHHAQDHLGEVVFVELPESGSPVSQGKSFGAVESVKATSDVNSPISGEVVDVNSKLAETPGLVIHSHIQQHPHIRRGLLLWFLTNFFSHIYIYIYIYIVIKINSSPYEEGWMIKVKPSSPSELESLMGPQEYTKFCEEEDAAH